MINLSCSRLNAARAVTFPSEIHKVTSAWFTPREGCSGPGTPQLKCRFQWGCDCPLQRTEVRVLTGVQASNPEAALHADQAEQMGTQAADNEGVASPAEKQTINVPGGGQNELVVLDEPR